MGDHTTDDMITNESFDIGTYYNIPIQVHQLDNGVSLSITLNYAVGDDDGNCLVNVIGYQNAKAEAFKLATKLEQRLAQKGIPLKKCQHTCNATKAVENNTSFKNYSDGTLSVTIPENIVESDPFAIIPTIREAFKEISQEHHVLYRQEEISRIITDQYGGKKLTVTPSFANELAATISGELFPGVHNNYVDGNCR